MSMSRPCTAAAGPKNRQRFLTRSTPTPPTHARSRRWCAAILAVILSHVERDWVDMLRKSALALGLIGSFAAAAHADTITFKNGHEVHGRLVKETDTEVIFQVG